MNNGDIEAEIQIKIYDKDNQVSNGSNKYQFDNGVLNQKLFTNMNIGKRDLEFPIEFPTKCNGVFVVTKDVENYVRVLDIKNSGCTIEITPHHFDMDKKIELQATGY